MGFPDGSDGRDSAYNGRDLSLISGLGRSPGGRHGNPLQYACLENAMDRGAWGLYSPQGLKELDTTDRISTAQLLKTLPKSLCSELENLCVK